MSREPEHPPTAEDSAPPRPDLSLESLTHAFAEMLGQAERPADEGEAAGGDEEVSSPERAGDEADFDRDDDPVPITPQSVIEALLFVGDPENRPLSAEHIAEQIRGVEPDEVEELVGELNAEYREQNAAFEIVRQEGGWHLRLREQHARVRDKFYGKVREAKLSQQAIEVLALVAYNQPLTGDDVAELRGRPSGALLSQLVRRQLLAIERPTQPTGGQGGKRRRVQYRTTERFLVLFGLGSLEELPDSPELE